MTKLLSYGQTSQMRIQFHSLVSSCSVWTTSPPTKYLELVDCNVNGYSRFSAIFHKEDNLCDFMFAFLHTKPSPFFPVRVDPFSEGSKSFPFREGPFSERSKGNFGEAASPESVNISLKKGTVHALTMCTDWSRHAQFTSAQNKGLLMTQHIWKIINTVFTLNLRTHYLLTTLVLKFEHSFYHLLMCPRTIEWQTGHTLIPDALFCSSWSSFTLFVQACLSQYLG